METQYAKEQSRGTV